jgi:hypothetical protein
MTNPVPLDLQAKISTWRMKAAEGTLTFDEMKEGIILLRAGRTAANVASATATKRKKSIAEIPSADDMLGELDNL